MEAYCVVFRGDATTGGFPIAITSASGPVRAALQAGLHEVWLFARESRDEVLRAKAKGNIAAIQTALTELDSSGDESALDDPGGQPHRLPVEFQEKRTDSSTHGQDQQAQDGDDA